MRRSLIVALIIALFVAACTPEPTPAPTATQAAPPPASITEPSGSARTCGDNVCDGPENALNCPQDCPPEAIPGPRPTLSGAGETPVGEAGAEQDTYWVTNPTSGAQIFVRIIHPQGWEGAALPALVLVAGGSSWSSDFTEPPYRGQTIADGGYTVVVFDPDGRGASSGEENDNGFVQQDGLAAVVSFAATLPEVDSSQIGMVSYSFGITLAAGALARHPNLPVRFLLDWEGPADRNDTGGCDESRVGHLQFMSCDDEEFWGEREAATFARDLQMPYQRLQCEQDHAQPDFQHALVMIANATAVEYGGSGRAPWTRLNDFEPNTVHPADLSVPMLPEPVCRALEPLVISQVEELFNLE